MTKVFPATVIRDAYELGLREFGENYVQEFEGKAPHVTDCPMPDFTSSAISSRTSTARGRTIPGDSAVDSAKLARRLNEGAALDVMIEVKLSAEGSKSGAAPDDVPAIVEACRGASNLRLSG